MINLTRCCRCTVVPDTTGELASMIPTPSPCDKPFVHKLTRPARLCQRSSGHYPERRSSLTDSIAANRPRPHGARRGSDTVTVAPSGRTHLMT
jgi:hypothetical protein